MRKLHQPFLVLSKRGRWNGDFMTGTASLSFVSSFELVGLDRIEQVQYFVWRNEVLQQYIYYKGDLLGLKICLFADGDRVAVGTVGVMLHILIFKIG
jgi:hypothetical protein